MYNIYTVIPDSKYLETVVEYGKSTLQGAEQQLNQLELVFKMACSNASIISKVHISMSSSLALKGSIKSVLQNQQKVASPQQPV